MEFRNRLGLGVRITGRSRQGKRKGRWRRFREALAKRIAPLNGMPEYALLFRPTGYRIRRRWWL
jgi:hypothetical protein